jgi:hypothetical protein
MYQINFKTKFVGKTSELHQVIISFVSSSIAVFFFFFPFIPFCPPLKQRITLYVYTSDTTVSKIELSPV